MSAVIEVNGLQKRYGSRAALQGISFCVHKGEIFGLLGANGAGKTTALACMEGLLARDGGSIAVRGRMGVQLQSAALPEHIRAMEAVRLFAGWKRAAVDGAALEALGIHEIARKQYRTLSTGQKRRLHLAIALLGDPEILFLDEPAAGLDVEGRSALHALIRALRQRGKTIILASHDMAEVEELCDRIAILRAGRIAFLGTVRELTAKLGKHYNIVVQSARGSERFETDDIETALPKLLARYREAGVPIADLQVNRGTLEQHFLQIAGGDFA